ncbi:MerR family transcriptional regulator [Nocardia sp. NPDC050175]|uniref:MerR family transcriptional regulator n=1 Tax=Nocardia sp. NPDC050175 TaxID=3364317 RepID=UPI003789E47C
MSIGEVADQTGLSVHALRFYEREELLVGEVVRTSGGRRRYSPTDVEWLQICTRLRESGMPMAQLREFAALVREGPGNEKQRLELLQNHETRIRAQLSALQQCLDVIEHKVNVYQEHVANDTADGLWDPTR